MNEVLQEFVSSRGATIRVDREAGVIRGVKLLGLESRNGRRYLPAALAQAAVLYEGAKVNVNHPKGHPLAARDYQDRLGSIRNVNVRDDGLFGDFHFNPKHALAEQLVWDADHAPENVGFSHNVEARTRRQANETLVEAILKVQSVDLVADPATTRGLYESAALDEQRAQRAASNNTTLEHETADLALLRAENDRLRACEAARERRGLVARLLEEYRLPDPDSCDAATRPIVSEYFLETLMAAPDERATRELVEERARLVTAACQLERSAGRAARPMSREQNRVERVEMSAKQFADAIR